MEARKLVLGAVLLVGMVISLFVNRKGATHSVESVIARQVETYRCMACGKDFEMTGKKAMSLVKRGKTEAKPNEVARFPCEHCGEVKAVAGAFATPKDGSDENN